MKGYICTEQSQTKEDIMPRLLWFLILKWQQKQFFLTHFSCISRTWLYLLQASTSPLFSLSCDPTPFKQVQKTIFGFLPVLLDDPPLPPYFHVQSWHDLLDLCVLCPSPSISYCSCCNYKVTPFYFKKWALWYLTSDVLCSDFKSQNSFLKAWRLCTFSPWFNSVSEQIYSLDFRLI